MSKEEILAMKPGRELNIKVAKDVMCHEVISDEIFGHVERYIDEDNSTVHGPVQPYSEDISAAQLVVDKMIKLGHGDAVFWEHYGNGIYTPSEAICKVALLVVLGAEKEQEEVTPISPEIEKFLREVSDNFNDR
jgi:hypothetical protein